MAGTRWAKIDTTYFRNPKVAAVSTQAMLMHLASILFAVDQTTNGEIAAHSLPDIAHMARVPQSQAPRRADELDAGELWIANGGSWHIHDFDVMNPQALREAVEKQRAKWRHQKGYDE
jgi:hypothetical protein